MTKTTIEELWDLAGPVEREVIHDFARRIVMGQELYGLLNYYKKDWTKEAYEEALDLAVYLTTDLKRRQIQCGKDLKKVSGLRAWVTRLYWTLRSLFL